MARSLTQNSRLNAQNSIWLWPAVITVALIVGITPPLYTAAAIIGIAVTALILRNPVWGAYALVLSVPVQKAITLSGGVTVTQVLFVFVLGVWWAWLALRRDRRMVLTPIAIALFLFLAASLASLWYTTSMLESLAEISRWLVTILAYVIIINSVQTRREMNVLIAVMLIAGMSEALLGLVQAYSGIGPESFNVENELTRAY